MRADPFRLRAEVECDDRGTSQPRLGNHQAMRLGPDRRNDDETDAVSLQQ